MKNWLRMRVFKNDKSIRLCLVDNEPPQGFGYKETSSFYVLHPQIGPPLPIGCRLFLVHNSTIEPYQTLQIETPSMYIHKFVPFRDGFFFIAFVRNDPLFVPVHFLNGINGLSDVKHNNGNASIISFFTSPAPLNFWRLDTDGYCMPSKRGIRTLRECQQLSWKLPLQSRKTFLGHSYFYLFGYITTKQNWVFTCSIVLFALILCIMIWTF